MTTIIIGLIVASILFLDARQIYKNKKAGKSLCSGKCSGCPNCGACHEADKR